MLTPSEVQTLLWLLAIGLTIGAVLVIVVFAIACAMSGLTDLSDTEPDEGLDDLQREVDQFMHGPREIEPQPLHPALRESGYYGSPEHQQRQTRVTRAMGGSDAA